MKIIRKICLIFMILCMSMIICSCKKNDQVLTKEYFQYFDTSCKVYSFNNESLESFFKTCDEIEVILKEYHQLLDIYYEYSSVTNLCTINKRPLEEINVSSKLIEFLTYCKEVSALTNGKFNIMFGSVLKLWHDARETSLSYPDEAYIPSIEQLQLANTYTNLDLLQINEETNTVKINASNALIDVGGVAKGYVVEVVAKYLEAKGLSSYVLNFGGNIRYIGNNKYNELGFYTGIKDPFNPGLYALCTYLSDTSCVTSGSYERYYTYEGVNYHHIIDQNTLYPSTYFTSVTVIGKDSGLCDALSTTLFTMSYEEGLALLGNFEGYEAFFIFPDQTIKKTSGIKEVK